LAINEIEKIAKHIPLLCLGGVRGGSIFFIKILLILSKKSSMKIKIREFVISDYHHIVELWKEAKLPYKPNGRDSMESIEKELQKGYCNFLVAEDNNKIVGSILGTNDGRKGWVNRLAVKTEYRKKGLANQLLEELEKIFNELGIGIIACLIEDDNPDSLKVFSKFGYSEFKGMHYLTKKKHSEI